jgi:hypothetical protein
MNGERTRACYARWEAQFTERLIRLILTEEPLMLKMRSLVDKHHTKREETTTHLKYGAMKDYATKIGLGRGDSRALSIKMINVAKSYGRKKELAGLFAQGWRVAKQMRDEKEGNVRTRSPNGSSKLPDLEDLVAKITEKVIKFNRKPYATRAKKLVKTSVKQSKKDRRRPPTQTISIGSCSPLVDRRLQPEETQSMEVVSLARAKLDMDDDKLSRGGESAIVPCSDSSNEKDFSRSSENFRHTLEKMVESIRPRSKNETPNRIRVYNVLRKVISLHFCVVEREPQFTDPRKRQVADRLLKKTIMKVMAEDNGAASK